MANPGHLEVLCTSGDLYSEAFIKHFGTSNCHWNSDTWFQRESSLRHDMVCILLCNLELDEGRRELNIDEDLYPPPLKRARTTVSEPSSSSTASTDRGLSSSDGGQDPMVLSEISGDEGMYRYILLEGRSNVAQIQSKLSSLAGIPPMRRQYDIFDKKELKFIEVKVTLNRQKTQEEFHEYTDSLEHTALIHLNPETFDHYSWGKQDAMPGLSKAIEFLTKRKTYLSGVLNFKESDLHSAVDMTQTILSNTRFNESVREWTQLFWAFRNKPVGDQSNFAKTKKSAYIVEAQLKELIVDTSKRNAPFMTFPGKVLPLPFVSYIETELSKDADIIDLITQDLNVNPSEPKADVINWFLSKWRKGVKNTFCLSSLKERKNTPKDVLVDLGIGCKKTIRNDNFEELKQPEFQPPGEARYSAWMSNLLCELATENDSGVNHFEHLQEQEMENAHPMNVIVSRVANEYFRLFGRSKVGDYCSRLKNVYSRFGGAYIGAPTKGKDRVDSVIFPIYSVGTKDGKQVRLVSGFIIRGPQHAKAATDKIPFISIEMLAVGEGLKYRQFIRHAHIFYDTLGRAWCYRVNSVMKGSSSYIAFCTNAAYLPANMLGELTLGNPHNRTDYAADRDMLNFISNHSTWLLERCSESVIMAAIGGSQEEGAMAIIRKIFMLKLNWSRGQSAIGNDTAGLAEALNETLINSPFALYLGQQIRMILAPVGGN